MRLFVRFLVIWMLCAALTLLGRQACAWNDANTPVAEMLEDAELASIFFVNADVGWTVGDRGAIWHTTDGGRSWRLQLSPTSARLSSVHFVDEQTGWAVGGATQPYTKRSTGIILRTRDGGLQWTAIPDLTLPALRWVRFIDKQRGWAAGESSAFYPTGVFWTSDGGRSWLPVPRGPAVSWQSAELGSDGFPVLIAADGRKGRASYQEVRLIDSKVNPLETHAIALGPQGEGVSVGAGGHVKITTNFGNTWQTPVGKLPPVASQFDLRAAAIRGKHLWLAGTPGSIIFRSTNGGESWETLPTESPTPLQAIQFLDDQRGWAVGTFGTILATRDGGRSWLPQRRGGKQAALLGVFSEPTRVPWEWFAQYAGNDAYLSCLEIIGQRSANPQRQQIDAARTHEALVAVGGSHASTAWQFPLPPLRETPHAESMLKTWNELHGNRGAAYLEEHLVRQLRMWRPEVIFTEDVSPKGDDPQGHLINQAVLAAVQQAADATIYPDHLTQLGLSAWKVKKVVTHIGSERRGVLTLSTSQLAPRLGKSLAEAAEAGRSLLSERQQIPPVMYSASILVDSLPQGMGRQDLFSGISVRPGGEARRKLGDPVGGSMESLTRLAQKRHNIQQLIARTAGDSPQAATWLSQVTELTAGMSERAAGEVLFQLGARYQQAGKLELAADAFVMLVERNPQHPLTDSAALWLLKYYASPEIAWRLQGEHKYNVQVARFESTVERPDPATNDSEKKSPAIGPNLSTPNLKPIENDVASPPAVKTLRMTERANKALAIAKLIERARPAFFAEPAVKFPLFAAQRHANSTKVGEKPYENLLNLGPDQPWSKAIAAENWLPQMRGKAPQRLVKIVKANKPPVLNGHMDDEVWQGARAIALEPCSTRDEADSRVALAYDDQYFYLAASCSRARGVDYSATDKPRIHDIIPPNTDRLQLTFDLDRDYATGFQFVIDFAGRLGENCFGDSSWNPTWYVASAGNEQFWTIEVAIPREELTPNAPKAKDLWNIAIDRVIPTFGRQSLLPADDSSATEFQTLVFE